MADKQISQLVAASTVNDDDLLVLQQGGTAKKLTGKKLGDYVYAAAAEKIAEVEEAVAEAQAAVDDLEEQKDEIAQAVASMAELGTDTTLTTPGMAADAKATGDVKDLALAHFIANRVTGVPYASFDDGAEGIPLKSLIVDILPKQDGTGDPSPTNVMPISGWTGARVFRASKNLCNPAYFANTSVTDGQYTCTTSGYTANLFTGQNGSAQVIASNNFYKLPYLQPGTYTWSLKYISGGSFGTINIIYEDGTRHQLGDSPSGTANNYVSNTFTITKPARISITRASNTSPSVFEEPQLEVGSSRTAYEPYNASVYNIEFPQEAGTVYGGTLDVSKGVLTIDRAIVDLSSITWTMTTATSGNYFNSTINDMKYFANRTHPLVCSTYKVISDGRAAAAIPDKCIYNIVSSSTNRLAIRDSDYEDATTFNASVSGYCVYFIDTPVIYQLTPADIKTIFGLNIIWADVGGIEELIYLKGPTPAEEIERILSQMIAGVEETMEATENYTVGNLVVASNTLLHISENIASGETFSIGVNCYVTTIADEFATLSSGIEQELGNLGNLANLTYEVVT